MNYLENFTQKITDSGIEEEPAIVQYCKVLAAILLYQAGRSFSVRPFHGRGDDVRI